MQFTQPLVHERRRENRQPARVTCTLAVLGDSESRTMGCIVDWSPRGLGVVTTNPIPIDTAVGVEYAGVLIMAEVRSCVPDQKAFRIGLQVDQAVGTASARLSVAHAVREIQARLEEYDALVA
jgi:hypothetical protein